LQRRRAQPRARVRRAVGIVDAWRTVAAECTKAAPRQRRRRRERGGARARLRFVQHAELKPVAIRGDVRHIAGSRIQPQMEPGGATAEDTEGATEAGAGSGVAHEARSCGNKA
jgi:hypothetical protein